MKSEDYVSEEAIASSSWHRPFSKKNTIGIAATLFVAMTLSFAVSQNFGNRLKNASVDENSILTEDFDSQVPDSTQSLTSTFGIENNNEKQTEPEITVSKEDKNLDNYDDSLPENALADADYEMDQQVRNLADKVEKDTSVKTEGRWLTEDVQKGDTISSLFEDLNIPASVMMTILQNKKAAKEINHLQLGEHLAFLLNDDNILLAFVKPLDDKRQLRIYRDDINKTDFTYAVEPLGAHLSDNNAIPDDVIAKFEDKEKALEKKTESKVDKKTAKEPTVVAKNEDTQKPKVVSSKGRSRLVLVKIKRGETFSVAANKAGITYSEINRILQMFKGRIQFSKNIRAGDTMRVLFTDDKGKGKIAAVEFNLSRGGKISSYLNTSDNKYYDERGLSSVKSSFRRIPFNARARITSPFNPGRRHPVLRTVRPHNGTDFGLPVGTPIIAPSDGVVDKAAYSRSAGYYIVLRHRGGWSTVYMHLSKLQVRQGQRIKMGSVIARSGNTGISTGPHLHYELRINGRPVNAMRVNLGSRDVEVNKKQKQRFRNTVAKYKRDLHKDSLIAKQQLKNVAFSMNPEIDHLSF